MAAMTTIESESMIVWFTPAMMVGRAKGSCTLTNFCMRVLPNASAASIISRSIWRMPSAVRRMAGGMEKITVANDAATGPNPKKGMAGIK